MAVTQGSGTSSKSNRNPAYQTYLDSLPNGTPSWAGRTQSELLRQQYANDVRPKVLNDAANSSKPKPSPNPSGSRGSGGSTGPTSEQKKAAKNLSTISKFNAKSTKNQLLQQFDNYDMSDKQNRALTDVQKDQTSRQGAGDRFAQQLKLQSSTNHLRNAAGNALMGSALGGLVSALGTRNDLDNNAVWSQVSKEHGAAENKFMEAFNANQLGRNEAASNAEFALRGVEADLAAQRNNIDSSLFVAPGAKGKTTKKGGKKVTKPSGQLGSDSLYDRHKVKAGIAKLGGYMMPADAQAQVDALNPANPLAGNDYFSKLLNGYTQRSY